MATVSRELSWDAVLARRVVRQGLAERAAAADWPAVVSRIAGLDGELGLTWRQ